MHQNWMMRISDGEPCPHCGELAPGSSSSGSSGSSGCTVGMNVERCEDRLGLGPGERFPYIDCSGSNRSIFWATNWWIIGVRNGTAIVSKSPYGCD